MQKKHPRQRLSCGKHSLAKAPRMMHPPTRHPLQPHERDTQLPMERCTSYLQPCIGRGPATEQCRVFVESRKGHCHTWSYMPQKHSHCKSPRSINLTGISWACPGGDQTLTTMLSNKLHKCASQREKHWLPPRCSLGNCSCHGRAAGPQKIGVVAAVAPLPYHAQMT